MQLLVPSPEKHGVVNVHSLLFSLQAHTHIPSAFVHDTHGSTARKMVEGSANLVARKHVYAFPIAMEFSAVLYMVWVRAATTVNADSMR